MTIKSAKYVSHLADLLKGLEYAQESFHNGDYPHITWGDAWLTLIDKHDYIRNVYDNFDIESFDDSDGVLAADMKELKKRISEIPDDVMIDMES